MNKNLVIVESPAKAKTIEKYLGSDFVVVASFGHVRDLPKGSLGIDIENDFKPSYSVLPKSRKIVAQLKKMAKSAPLVYLATDLDREGEAISWHIAQACGLQTQSTKADEHKVRRITFNEITKPAVLSALENPRDIDMNLVDSQQARRVIDRLLGYNLSPLLWKKVYKGLSAGRVQSVALRLVVEREREIESFKPEEYWDITALLEKDGIEFVARLVEENGKKIEKLDIKTEKQAQEYLEKLEKGKYEVILVEKKTENKYPSAPFTTSTLQQEAGNILGFSAKQTMKLAQDLYEAGYITYMRTDSVNLSEIAIKSIRDLISKKYGASYLPKEPKRYKTKSRLAQEAHEAIRPTDIFKVADNITEADARAKKLYELIWKRTVASQMKEAVLEILEARIKNNEFIFAARGQTIGFKGFLVLFPQKVREINLPSLTVKDILSLVELKKEQHFTEPPARYSEATLVKALEERGIGRPSTYAPTISTIQERGYVIKDRGRLKPEKVGFVVNDLLVENFPNVVDYGFTAKIEDELDEIASGKRKWQVVVKDFWEPFNLNLKEKADTIEKQNMDEEIDELCPNCGKKLVIKHSTRGKFIGCSGFPECRFTKNFIDEKTQNKIDEGNKLIEGRKCPKCGSDLKIASGRYGPFIGCSAYPKCKYIEKIPQITNSKSQNDNSE